MDLNGKVTLFIPESRIGSDSYNLESLPPPAEPIAMSFILIKRSLHNKELSIKRFVLNL